MVKNNSSVLDEMKQEKEEEIRISQSVFFVFLSNFSLSALVEFKA